MSFIRIFSQIVVLNLLPRYSIQTQRLSSAIPMAYSMCKPAEGGKEVVEKLLEKAHSTYDINYEGYLANHLPHALYTLYSLGASKSKLEEYNEMYVRKLEPLRKPKFVINASNWKDKIGDKTIYSEYLQFFDGEVATLGLKGTLDHYYPQIMGESLGAALHPLIQIGYAMEYSNPLLLAEGLSYTCIYPLKNTGKILTGIDTSKKSGNFTSVIHLIEELHKTKELPEKMSDDIGHFGMKTQYLLETHGKLFRDLISRWDLSESDKLPAKLNELTEASILGVFGTYSNKIDFFLLHGVTGTHAVRSVFPHLPLELQRYILRVNLLGIMTDYVVQRRPKIDHRFITEYKESVKNEEILWKDVVPKAIGVEEEHVCKVVRSLIHYMEVVPTEERSELFSDKFIKRCAFKAVDILKDINDYIF